ncbi:MAG TPA: tRNA (guanosine(37)-N1)-methyltransferase TrmD, partial [Dehalococcoidia bacterium]|nr:tRNA (guanosine(37)-N1)-methyltransferase TrmD [Dehalococcoidia bacterium]
YTRPAVFKNWEVPEILLSGNHGEIAKWRREQSIIRTAKRRPELLDKADLSKKEMELVKEKYKNLFKEEGHQSENKPKQT